MLEIRLKKKTFNLFYYVSKINGNVHVCMCAYLY